MIIYGCHIRRQDFQIRPFYLKTMLSKKFGLITLVKGWAEGIQQGLNIFKVHMHQLSRDFNGMVLYKRLLAKNMVSPHFMLRVRALALQVIRTILQLMIIHYADY